MSYTNLIMLVLFFAALKNFSITLAGAGVSANYIYMFFPFVFLITGIKRQIIFRKQAVQIVLFYCVVYFLGIPGDIIDINSDLSNPFRRFTSFLVFIFPLFLSFIRFRPNDFQIFKLSIVLASLYYSVINISVFYSVHSIETGIASYKGVVGSQRYGFILCMGFFVSLLNERLLGCRFIGVQRLIFCSIILVGIAFTFSRASIVSWLGGMLFLFTSRLFGKTDSIKERAGWGYQGSRPSNLLLSCVLVCAMVLGTMDFYEIDIFRFYETRMVESILVPMSNFSMIETMQNNPGASEGYRYKVTSQIINYLGTHPFFGSHYKGLYLLFEEYHGAASSHNQYLDVLLRVGLFGSVLWLCLLVKIFRFCSYDEGLLVSIVSILIFGLVHETFKLSHGSFVFGMLLSFSYLRYDKDWRKR